MSEIWMSYIRNFLRSKLFWNPNFFSTDFRLFMCLKFKLFGNWIVVECMKSIVVRISDTYCNWKNYVYGENGLRNSCWYSKSLPVFVLIRLYIPSLCVALSLWRKFLQAPSFKAYFFQWKMYYSTEKLSDW